MRTSLLHRLSLRVRILCVVGFIGGSLLPPYIPSASLASGDTSADAVATPQFLFVEDGFLMKTSSLGEQGTRLAYSEGLVHTVEKGETVESIAKQYGITAQTIIWTNNLQPRPALKPGIELVILPVDGVLHTVSRGQTLARIAQIYGVPAEEIARQNKVKGGFIVAGQQLIIPGGKPITNPVIANSTLPTDKLQFADKLPTKDIALNFGGPTKPPLPADLGPIGTKIAPDTIAQRTNGILQMPCNNCSFTQYFNPGHYAVDIQTRGGGPVFAASDGTVIRAEYGWDGGYGNVIEIDHGNGLVTLYAHNKELYVKKGDKVTRGQTISWMGHTGFVIGATGIHVHFEVRVNGEKKNPLLYLQG